MVYLCPTQCRLGQLEDPLLKGLFIHMSGPFNTPWSLSPHVVSHPPGPMHAWSFLQHGGLGVAAFLTWQLASKRQDVEDAKPIKGYNKN